MKLLYGEPELKGLLAHNTQNKSAILVLWRFPNAILVVSYDCASITTNWGKRRPEIFKR